VSFLEGTLTTIALCWRIERCDGIALGLTDHDRDLLIDGLVHRAASGMTPSAIRREPRSFQLSALTSPIGEMAIFVLTRSRAQRGVCCPYEPKPVSDRMSRKTRPLADHNARPSLLGPRAK
jgi:hypothetical protein